MPRIEPFEKYSEKYEDWFERNEFVYKSEIQAIKELLPKVKKGIEKNRNSTLRIGNQNGK